MRMEKWVEQIVDGPQSTEMRKWEKGNPGRDDAMAFPLD